MLKPHRPIVLLTDFGQQDTFVGVLKGVIASISPRSKVMDLTHGVRPQDILHGSFLLSISFSYFPRGSVFCVIVDPGVGSSRKGICIETQDYIFLGPDNGVLYEAATLNKIKRIIHLTNKTYFLDSVSSTFHGRDIFAPVAAHISKGHLDISSLGRPLKKCVEYQFPPVEKKHLSLEVTVIHIDGFGNVTLNIQEKEFQAFVKNKAFCLILNNVKIKKTYKTYSQAMAGEFFLISSSSSHMEIALKNSNAAGKISAARMDRGVLERLDP